MIRKLPFHEEICNILIGEHNRPIPKFILIQKVQRMYHITNYKLLNSSIEQMIQNDEIKELNSKSLVIKHLVFDERLNFETITGTIKLNSKQNGFVTKLEEKDAKYFVPSWKLNGALDGDIVEISLLKMYEDPNNKKNSFLDAEVDKVVQHKKDFYTGTFLKDTKNNYKIIVDDNKFYFNVKLDDTNGLTNGTKILFKVNNYDDEIAYASLVKIIGNISDVGNDILASVYDAGIDPEFSDEIIKLANSLEIKWNPNNPGNRVDLTNENFITIDPTTSKDFDDSILVKKSNEGYVLNVAIADVGHFVKYNSLLSKEALKRGTSVYLTDRVVPMYPHIISDDICSLNPNVVRFTVNCEIQIDKNGNYKDIKMYKAAILSKRRFSYDEVNDFFDHKTDLPNDGNDIKQMLKIAYELHNILRSKKREEGYIDFEIKEPKIIVDETGFPIDITTYESGEAQRMIEDFMIAANECTALYAIRKNLPFIYRTHDQPDLIKLEEFRKLIKRINFKSTIDFNNLTSKSIVKWLDLNKDHPMIDIARKVLLQSMSKAKYSQELKEHFGIASRNYTHFTSPIRRFPDTLVSQILHMYVFDKDSYSKEDLENIKKDISEFAKMATEKEIIATKLGFDVNEMKFAEYMTKRVGNHYVGMITSINNFGAFVQLDNTIEGLIHITNMKNDFFSYDQENSVLVGRNTRMELHVGDKVEIEVLKADKQTRKIDFALVKKVN